MTYKQRIFNVLICRKPQINASKSAFQVHHHHWAVVNRYHIEIDTVIDNFERFVKNSLLFRDAWQCAWTGTSTLSILSHVPTLKDCNKRVDINHVKNTGFI